MGVEDFGVWSFLFSIISAIFLISNFGTNASGKFVAQHNRTRELKNVLANTFKLRLFLSSGFAVSIFIFSETISLLVGHPEFKVLFQYSAPLVFFMGFLEYLKATFMGLHRIKYNFIVSVLEFGFKFLFVMILFQFSRGITSILNAFSLASFISVIIGFWLLYHKFYAQAEETTHNTSISDIFNYAIPLFFTSLGSVIATEIDTIFLGIYSTSYEVGIYAVGKNIVNILPQISLAISMGTMPVFAKINDSNRAELKALFLRIMRINALIIGVIVGIILLFSGFFIPLIYGANYSDAVLPLQILTIFLVTRSFLIFLNQFLDYQGWAKKRLFNSLVSMILNIILNLLLIPRYGAIGAAIATSVAYAPYMILNWIDVKKIMER